MANILKKDLGEVLEELRQVTQRDIDNGATALDVFAYARQRGMGGGLCSPQRYR